MEEGREGGRDEEDEERDNEECACVESVTMIFCSLLIPLLPLSLLPVPASPRFSLHGRYKARAQALLSEGRDDDHLHTRKEGGREGREVSAALF